YPTLAALAGLPAPAGIDGRSFAATLRDPGAPHRDHVIHVYPRSPAGRGPILGRAIRTDRYRLVEWKKPGAPADTAALELYDYQADPLETKNLATAQPKVAARLQALLAQHPEAKPQLPNKPKAAAKPAQGRLTRNAPRPCQIPATPCRSPFVVSLKARTLPASLRPCSSATRRSTTSPCASSVALPTVPARCPATPT
ncbi:MAG: DUF4976 domain-containing protein, partial [Akkermansiaceae bacterium]|nr:DUF4976 domain-containing protein [Akkermansiaceae bacterium]